jgi:hypothetical protein
MIPTPSSRRREARTPREVSNEFKAKGVVGSSSASSETKPTLAEKYKYVRFVEKKKVLRKMRHLQQALQAGNVADRHDIEQQLDELRSDLLYIEKFPGNRKYIALFPTGGTLSEDCLRKQAEIRAMILNVTKQNAAKGGMRVIDVVKKDDFFASVDNVEKKAIASIAFEEVKSAPAPIKKTYKNIAVHPSWIARKGNEKLTGSIAGTAFEGSRLVFDDEE